MKIYRGSCHCGSVTFEVRKKEPISILIDCNCSICTKKGLLHTPVENDELTILSGEEHLRLYQFHTKTAKYWFCPTCGVEPFHRSRTNPQRYSVNARCLDDLPELLEKTGIWFVDASVHPLDQGGDSFPSRPNPYREQQGEDPGLVSEEAPVKQRRKSQETA
ncbi:MAG: GFA family protein [Pseudomonadota bacterium]